MEYLNIISENPIVFIVLLIILLINFCCIFYLVIREKNNDRREIDELLEDLNYKNDEVEEIQDKKLEENKKEVEEMLMKMQRDLEAKPEDVVTNFENEQEEKSIISYQELLESVKQAKSVNVTPVKIEDEKIDIDDDELVLEEYDDEDTMQIEIPKDEKKFKGTEFISPIFGKQENSIKYPTVPKTNITTELETKDKKEMVSTDYTEVTNKNNSFLKALKEFRRNLD